MIPFFRAVFARIKAMFAADALLEREGEIALRAAARKAALLRLAAQYESAGQTAVAHVLRKQVEVLDAGNALNAVPAIDAPAELPTSVLPIAHAQETSAVAGPPRKTATRSRRNQK